MVKQEFIGRSIIPLGGGVSRRGPYNDKMRLYDMKNCICDGESASRRPGSKNMLPLDEFDGNYILDELGWTEFTVSESRLQLGVDVKGQLWAMSDRFPQVKFRVWSKMRSTCAAPVTLPVGSSRYYSVDAEQFVFIVDERMQALRIDKRGKIEWWYGTKWHLASRGHSNAKQHQYYTGADWPELPTKAAPARIYLDCVDATNEKPDTFFMIENLEGNVYPVKGFVQFANVNDCGVVGEWSEKVPLTEWIEAYYSKYRGLGIIQLDGRSYVKLPEEEPVLELTGTDYLYSGYADGATELSTAAGTFIGTEQNDSTLFMLHLKIESGQPPKWICNIATSDGNISLWEYDYHKTINTMQIVSIKNGSDKSATAAVSSVDILLEVLGYISNQHESTIISNPKVTANAVGGSDPTSHYPFHADNNSAWGFEVKENETLKAIREQYQYSPMLYVRKPTGLISPLYIDYEVSPIIIFGALQRHANRRFRIPFDLTTETPTMMKHLGLDTWTRITKYSMDYTSWFYEADLGLMCIGDTVSTEGDVIMGVPTTEYVGGQAAYLRDYRFAVNENGKTVLVSQKFWVDGEGEVVYEGKDATTWQDGITLTQKASPIMSPHYRTVRNVEGFNITETAKVAKACLSRPAYCGAHRLYFIDGANLVTSDLTLLDRGAVKGILGSPRAVVPFYSGVLCFTTTGAYFVPPEGMAVMVPEGKPSGKAIAISGGVVALSDDGDVLLYHMAKAHEAMKERIEAVSLTSNIPDVHFGEGSSLAFADDTLFVSADNEVWGFSFKGGLGGWMRIDKYDYSVKALGVFYNRLVILFNQEPQINKVYEPIVPPVS